MGKGPLAPARTRALAAHSSGREAMTAVRVCSKCGTDKRYADGKCRACRAKYARTRYIALSMVDSPQNKRRWRCQKCGKSKSGIRFPPGRLNKCKSCVQLVSRLWRERNRALLREKRRAYMKSHKSQLQAARRLYEANNKCAIAIRARRTRLRLCDSVVAHHFRLGPACAVPKEIIQFARVIIAIRRELKSLKENAF